MLDKTIEGLQAQKSTAWDAAKALVDKAEEESRVLTDEEQEKYDGLTAEMRTLQTRIETHQELEKYHTAQQAKPLAPAKKAEPITTKHLPSADPSLFFAKQAVALYQTGSNRRDAAEFAMETWGDEQLSKVFTLPKAVVQQVSQAAIAKANPGVGDSTTPGWAAELVQVYQATEAYIDALRNASVVARFPSMQMGFQGNGSITIPRNAGPSAGAWVGEKKAIKVDAIAFDTVTLAPLKNANIITATNELLMRSDPSALAIIRDDIVQGVATSIDTKFTSADAASAGVSPAGLQTFDSSPTASTGTGLDEITADLRGMINQLLALNMPMTRPIWIINPVNVNYLRFIRDGLGTYAYMDEIMRGTIVGYPFLESNSMAATELILCDASQVIIASEMTPDISISEDASLHMEDTAPSDDIGGATSPVYNMFQMDSVAIRAKSTLDWNVRHADCVSVLTGVAW